MMHKNVHKTSRSQNTRFSPPSVLLCELRHDPGDLRNVFAKLTFMCCLFSACIDKAAGCAKWASKGECGTSRFYMLSNYWKSCRYTTFLSWNIIQGFIDRLYEAMDDVSEWQAKPIISHNVLECILRVTCRNYYSVAKEKRCLRP